MPTEEEIRTLAYKIWQDEGQPEGKDVEHYYRARQMLEEREASMRVAKPEAKPQPTRTATKSRTTPPRRPAR